MPRSNDGQYLAEVVRIENNVLLVRIKGSEYLKMIPLINPQIKAAYKKKSSLEEDVKNLAELNANTADSFYHKNAKYFPANIERDSDTNNFKNALETLSSKDIITSKNDKGTSYDNVVIAVNGNIVSAVDANGAVHNILVNDIIKIRKNLMYKSAEIDKFNAEVDNITKAAESIVKEPRGNASNKTIYQITPKSLFSRSLLAAIKVQDVVEYKDKLYLVVNKNFDKLTIYRMNGKKAEALVINSSDVSLIIKNESECLEGSNYPLRFNKKIRKSKVEAEEFIRSQNLSPESMEKAHYLVKKLKIDEKILEQQGSYPGAKWYGEGFMTKNDKGELIKEGYTDLTELWKKANGITEDQYVIKMGNKHYQDYFGVKSERVENILPKDFVNLATKGSFVTFINDYNIYRIEELSDEGITLSFSSEDDNGVTNSRSFFMSIEDMAGTNFANKITNYLKIFKMAKVKDTK